ncbi:hypothetical protein BDF20DRAFT_850451 [Mycotypha africana]|uniref:uncharacterized protein n=1 Tax=Mycotypha africana TaxID=64632 RepID=UPI0023012E19|nr:uncharacterized protein BDF20DRAFT_850451 [Mycotypha africana]KAI8987466.1 hypothetical protein BDF20DRAFT_850451 [Mycotypha africana]
MSLLTGSMDDQAPGLSILPFQLIKGKRRIDRENDEITNRLMIVREQQKRIEHKYAGSNKALSSHDYRTLENLNDEERYELFLCVLFSEVRFQD